MKAYLFTSLGNDQVSALTSDRDGANLPENLAPWKAISGGASVYIGHDSDYIAQAIIRDGYYLLTDNAEGAA